MDQQLAPQQQLPTDPALMLKALQGAGNYAYDNFLPDYMKPNQAPVVMPDAPGKMPMVDRPMTDALAKGAVEGASWAAGGLPKLGAAALSHEIPAALFLVAHPKVPGEFKVVNDLGNKVADSFMHYQPAKKNVFIDYIDASKNFDPAYENSIGYKDMKSLFSSIKNTFPEAETASGKRIGGARAKVGNMNETVVYKLPAATPK